MPPPLQLLLALVGVFDPVETFERNETGPVGFVGALEALSRAVPMNATSDAV